MLIQVFVNVLSKSQYFNYFNFIRTRYFRSTFKEEIIDIMTYQLKSSNFCMMLFRPFPNSDSSHATFRMHSSL